jgi:hypothetical protein
LKTKVRLTIYLPRRLVKVLEDIEPLFRDTGLNDPKRGALTRALEHVVQQYMESEDYFKKVKLIKEEQWEIFLHLTKREHEYREFLKEKEKSE